MLLSGRRGGRDNERTHLCRICSSLYSSSRITTPANVSTNMATRMSKLQQDLPAGPGELHALVGGATVCRGTSRPRAGLMMDWARYGWSWSGSGTTGWGGICREVPLVTRRTNCIAAVSVLMQRWRAAVQRELCFHLTEGGAAGVFKEAAWPCPDACSVQRSVRSKRLLSCFTLMIWNICNEDKQRVVRFGMKVTIQFDSVIKHFNLGC